MTLGLLSHLNPMAQWDRDARIAIKPNLVTATPAGHGATTHPEIVEGLLIHLLERGFRRIKIVESSWVGDDTDKAFAVCGYQRLSEKYNIPLVNLKNDDTITKKINGVELEICRTMETVDYLINVPLIKGHCQTTITCALKNLKGVIPDREKRRFHTMGLHQPIALLNRVVKQDLIIADAVCPDPFFEEGGRPRRFNRIVAGCDPVRMDCYAARTLGHDPEEIAYIDLAAKLGVGSLMAPGDPVEFLNRPGTKDAPDMQALQLQDGNLPKIPHEREACSACMGNLVSALCDLEQEEGIKMDLERIAIGQGHAGSSGEVGQLGIGDCTDGFDHHLAGCPPAADDIKAFLREMG